MTVEGMGGALKAKRVKKEDKGRDGEDWGNYINTHIQTYMHTFILYDRLISYRFVRRALSSSTTLGDVRGALCRLSIPAGVAPALRMG